MLAAGLPVHVVAAWHGHDPAVSLSIYSDAQREDCGPLAPHSLDRSGPTREGLGHSWPTGSKSPLSREPKTRSDLVRAGFMLSG